MPIRTVRRPGKLRELESALPKRFAGKVGIGHTRWATHGAPSEANAHPQRDASGHVAVVHNGIVENSADLRAELELAGVAFASETDTECIAQLIGQALEQGDGPRPSLEDAVRAALARIEGTYGLVVIDALQPDTIVAARSGSPTSTIPVARSRGSPKCRSIGRAGRSTCIISGAPSIAASRYSRTTSRRRPKAALSTAWA